MGSGTHTSTAEADQQTTVDAMLLIEHAVSCVLPDAGLQMIGFCRRRLDAAEAAIVAGRYDAGASDSQVEDLFTSDGKTSKAQARKTASRGKAVHANPGLGDKLASGDLSTEQADVLAAAAADSDGAAACDDELIETVSKATPEQGKRKAKEWVTKRKSADDLQSEHDRQHRNRRVYRTRRRDGRHQLIIEGSETAIDRIERRIDEQGDLEYQADGGRDVARHRHPRTSDQRCFDAAEKLLLGNATDLDTPKSANKAGRAGRRSTTFVTLTIEQLTGIDRSVITACDGQPLPPSVVEQLACESDFVGVIFGEDEDTDTRPRRRYVR